VFSVDAVMVAFREEDYLLKKPGPEYREYMRTVPWRFIPHVF
jgi:protein-S-isoprenylcysteine O-methyltransferase Ste14